MNDPTQSTNPTGSGSSIKHHLPSAAPPPSSLSSPSTPHHNHHSNIHQSHSFSSYHPPPPPPPSGGYYYHHAAATGNSASPYSPIPLQQYNAHPQHSYSPYHHPSPHHGHHGGGHHHGSQHGHDYRGQQHSPATPSASTPWPLPPSSSYSEEKMDTSDGYSPTPSPPVMIATAVSGAHPEITYAATDETAEASNLSILANASMRSSSSSPLSSSAGPLKKRRKVDKKNAAAGLAKDESSTAAKKVSRESESDSPASMDSSSSSTTVDTTNNSHNVSSTINDDSSMLATEFPRLLHKLLTKGDSSKGDTTLGNTDKDKKKADDGGEPTATVTKTDSIISSAMEWLPHGKGFRVLRWDALCTEVLPNDFPMLCEDAFPNLDKKKMKGVAEGGSGGVGRNRGGIKQEEDDRDDKSNDDLTTEEEREEKFKFSDEQWIEAFLWHIQSWGFEEVKKSGRDRGSFRHEFFVRGSPKQCHKMRRCRPISSNNNRSNRSYSSHTPATYSLEIGQTSSFDVEHHHANSTTAGASWRKSPKVVSSIFKPRSRRSRSDSYNNHPSHHPSHLHVPMLASCATASTVDAYWGNSEYAGPTADHGSSHTRHHHYPPPPPQQHYFPPPYPTPTRSPKTIRFRDEPLEELASSSSSAFHHHHHQYGVVHNNDIAVEITPNSEASPPILLPRSSRNQHPTTSRSGSFPHRGGFVSRRGRRPALISRHATH